MQQELQKYAGHHCQGHHTGRAQYKILEHAQEDARKMVLTMVEMERSYLTAEVFREILQQNGRSDHSGELIRTLSGRQVRPCPATSARWH